MDPASPGSKHRTGTANQYLFPAIFTSVDFIVNFLILPVIIFDPSMMFPKVTREAEDNDVRVRDANETMLRVSVQILDTYTARFALFHAFSNIFHLQSNPLLVLT